MRLIGLTGGIGSGKSTASCFLREHGVTVVDADEGARAVVEPGTPGYDRVVDAFGSSVVRGGRLDRRRLAAIVFGDPQSLARLNSIVHPLIREWTVARLEEASRGGSEIVVQDIPLLFENSLENLFEATILVYTPAALQLERLIARGMDPVDAESRLVAQMPIDEKRGRANYVIDNSGSREATRDQLLSVWTEITAAGSSGP